MGQDREVESTGSRNRGMPADGLGSAPVSNRESESPSTAGPIENTAFYEPDRVDHDPSLLVRSSASPG